MVFGLGRGSKKKPSEVKDDEGIMRHILLTRDLSRFQISSAVVGSGEKPKNVTLRSSRLVTTLFKGKKRHIIVVRGKSMPGTLRMFQAVLRVISSMGDLSRPGVVEDLEQEWNKYLDTHISEGSEPEWIAVYYDGGCLINTRADRSIDDLEKLMIEGPVEHKHVAAFGADFFNHGVAERREVAAAHESQPVFNVDNMDQGVKVTIMNRQMGRGGQLSYRVPMPRLYDAFVLGADIVELHNRIAEFQMLKKKLLVDQDLAYVKKRAMVPASRELMEGLQQNINSKSSALNVEYTPAKPEFLIPG